MVPQTDRRANQNEGVVVDLSRHPHLHSPDPTVVQRQLALILSSTMFFRSERLSELLTAIVELSLRHENRRLTERSLGTLVFGKKAGWDPREDTIVRSEARRLRRKLREYYESGAIDPLVVIDLPLGAYVATFVQPQVLSTPPSFTADTHTNARLDGENRATLESTTAPAPEIAEHSAGPRAPVSLSRELVTLAGVALGCLILISWFIAKRHPARQPDSFVIQPFANEIGEEYSPTVSPDDRQLAYVWDGNVGKPNIYIQNTDGSSRRKVTTGSGEYYLPAWSSDGKQLSYIRIQAQRFEIVIRDLASGSERIVSSIRQELGRWSADSGPLLGNIGPEWSRDGEAVFFADRLFTDRGVGGIYRLALRDGHRTQITSAPGEQRDFSPRISPNGKTLAFVRYFSHGHGELFTVPVNGGQPTQLTKDNRNIQGATWSSDGASLIFCSNRSSVFQLWSISTTGGTPTLLPTNTTSATTPVSFHRSPAIAFVDSSENWNIWRYEMTATGLQAGVPIISSSGRNHDPRYSPDGKLIAFVSDRSGTLEVWVAKPDGTASRQLTHFGGPWVNSISWSPNAEWIAVDARPEGHASIYTIKVSDGNTRLFDDAGVEERMPAWSADGRSIYFNSVRDGAVAIYKKSLDTGAVVRVSEHEMYTVAESPDGKRLYYSDRGGVLYQADVDGSNSHPIGIRAFPVKSWATAGHELVYSSIAEDKESFQILAYDGKRSRVLGIPSKPLVTNDPDISLSPDSHTLVVAQQDLMRSDIKLRIPQ